MHLLLFSLLDWPMAILVALQAKNNNNKKKKITFIMIDFYKEKMEVLVQIPSVH